MEKVGGGGEISPTGALSALAILTTIPCAVRSYEFLLAKKFPKEARYCHNALVFAPDKTVLQSLKEIQTFDKSKVVPPGYVDWLNANLKFQFLDDTSLTLQIIENSEYNIVISNNQKIILKQSHAEKTAVDSLFAAEKKYTPVASKSAAIFDELDDGAARPRSARRSTSWPRASRRRGRMWSRATTTRARRT